MDKEQASRSQEKEQHPHLLLSVSDKEKDSKLPGKHHRDSLNDQEGRNITVSCMKWILGFCFN